MNRNLEPSTRPSVPGASDPPAELAALYERHARELRFFLINRCERSVVDDLAQDTWVKISGRYATQFDGGNFRAWMFEIARNTVTDHYRRNARNPVESKEWIDDQADPRVKDHADEMLACERIAAVRDCQRRLSERELCVFQQKLDNATTQEITAACECNANAVYKALHAAKTKLRECLERKTQ